MQVVAIDTETSLIGDRDGLERVGPIYRKWRGSTRGSKAILTSPWVCPPGIVMSWADGSGQTGYKMIGKAGPARAAARDLVLNWLLDPNLHLVFHNAPFDVGVLSETLNIERNVFLVAMESGRIHDTVLLDQLVSLAQGAYDAPYSGAPPERMVPRSLAAIAKARLGLEVEKDKNIRLTFEQFKDADELPTDWAVYAIKDASVTLELFKRFQSMYPGTDLSERYQVQVGQVVDHINRTGIRVDTAEANRLRDIFSKDIDPLEWRLVREGLGEWAPLTGDERSVTSLDIAATDVPVDSIPVWLRVGDKVMKSRAMKRRLRVWTAPATFKIRNAPIRAELQRLLDAAPHLDPPRTPSGEISLDGDWWKDKLPAGSPLKTWCAYSRLRKVLSTYLELYASAARVFPRWTIMVRSGRMSCSSPNVQNIPKRKYGLRSLFVPDPGHVFVVADYSMQELFTLAEVMSTMGIHGPLYDGLASGADLHKQTARLLKGAPPEAEVTKLERQGAKAVNFGCPGGLGPARLRDYAENEYGVHWDMEQAKLMWRRYRAAYPDVAEYMKRLQGSLSMKITQALAQRSFSDSLTFLGLGQDATAWDVMETLRCSEDKFARRVAKKIEHSNRVQLPTGRVRANCTFTEAANSYFQGLASDVTKNAAFRALELGLDVRLLVHDEIVIQCTEACAESGRNQLVWCMLEAFKEVCPKVGQYARVEADIRPRWGEAKDGEGRTV